MKNTKRKKSVCALLAAILILCGAGGVYGAADASNTVNLLSSIGVITPDSAGSYNLERAVTRAEFAKMLITASNYKDLVSAASSSVFKDVPASHWAAGYVKQAVTNGLLSGYSDGTFRPDQPVPLEQAANAALKLLGYAAADFRGNFPEAQMNMFRGSGLSTGVSGHTGDGITRGNAAQMLYNLLKEKMKDGTQTYAETLGFTMTAAGEVDYASVLRESMIGPYTVRDASWRTELGFSEGAFAAYRNGNAVAAADIKLYDIVYWNAARSAVWAYDKKVTGVYEKASPSQNDLDTVTVSGQEYPLESANAFAALSSSGTLRTGSTVTLLLGKNGGVADAVSSVDVNEAVALYVTETGTKTYTNAEEQSYTSNFVKGVSAGGDLVEYPVTQTWIQKGDVIRIDFAGGVMNVTKQSGGTVLGKVDASLYTIGGVPAAPDVRILDTDQGAYTAVSMQRLDGVQITSGETLYQEAENGKITALILKDVTGDNGAYGVVTRAQKTTTTDADGSSGVRGSYTYILEGAVRSLTTQNSSLGVVGTGPAKLTFSGETLVSMRNLRKTAGAVTSFTNTRLTCEGSSLVWGIAEKADVYELSDSNQYLHVTIQEALAAREAGRTVEFYYDDTPQNGGQIRILIIRS